jgi:carbon monoxide dehydrogenase subunit G
MELTGERLIPAPISATWAGLNDPEILKSCIAGCESLENVEQDTLAAVLALRIGPVSARFKGTLKLSEMQPPHSYVMSFEGQGGAAGFGKGSAQVSLVEEGTQTRLRYAARAQIGGRLAQVGSRLVDAAAAKITEEFFAAFEARLQPAVAASAQAPQETQAGQAASTGQAAGTGQAASTGQAARRLVPAWYWGLATAVVLAASYAFWK